MREWRVMKFIFTSQYFKKNSVHNSFSCDYFEIQLLNKPVISIWGCQWNLRDLMYTVLEYASEFYCPIFISNSILANLVDGGVSLVIVRANIVLLLLTRNINSYSETYACVRVIYYGRTLGLACTLNQHSCGHTSAFSIRVAVQQRLFTIFFCGMNL